MNMQDYKHYVKSNFLQLELREILQSPPSVLLGVSSDAELALRTIKIITVFDLGLSNIFQNAYSIVNASQNVGNSFVKYGFAPSDVVDSSASSTKINDLSNESIEILVGIGSANGAQIATALTVSTIRDLAFWPPFIVAKRLVDLAFNPNVLPEYDPEAPADLLPKTGEFPTDKVSYQTTVMIDAGPEPKLIDLMASGPVDLLNNAQTGFSSPATGALLTFSQSWYPKAVALGQLLYSLPLAPGESTKIAVIDWTRRTSATTEEDVAQTEKLSNTIVQSRAISEIASAVADEAQQGSSATASQSGSVTAGFGAGGAAGPVLLGGAVGASGNTSKASTFTTSKGSREVSSQMQQNISNSTQQNAFSSRNKRAAIVSEATQQEREQISTRTVTNYNHMHALSIQYYEVVQLYQTIVRLEKCERCLFIPMKTVNFNEQAIIQFRNILYNSALNDRIRELLVYSTGSVTTNIEAKLASQFKSEVEPETRDVAIEMAKKAGKAKAGYFANINALQNKGLIISVNDKNSRKSFEMAGSASFVGAYWNGDRVAQIVVKAEDGSSSNLVQRTSPPNPPQVHQGLVVPKPVSELSTIELQFSEADADIVQDMTLVFRLNSVPDQNLELKCGFVLPKERSRAPLISFSAPMITNELLNHLNENALYYSQQIWLQSDPSILALYLSPFEYKGKRVMEYIDPKPVKVAANFLIFRWKDEQDQAWKDWVKDNADKTKVDVDTVALPTGGIFAEAVLGRFNSAEKLDITRFWNWQDSPIPIQAPEIAAIQAGQHTVTEQPRPGNLESPIVNIQTPQALPDPTGMQGVLQVLAASNLFRDMSGIAQTAALAQSGLQNASAGSVAGMNQAGANMATFANYQVEMAKILASLAPMLFGLPPVPPPASKNISNAGATINHGADMDSRAGQGGHNGSGMGSSGSGNFSSQGGGGAGGIGGPTTTPDPAGNIYARVTPSEGFESAAFLASTNPNNLVATRSIPDTFRMDTNNLGARTARVLVDGEDVPRAVNHLLKNPRSNMPVQNRFGQTLYLSTGDLIGGRLILDPKASEIWYLEGDLILGDRPDQFFSMLEFEGLSQSLEKTQWLRDFGDVEITFLVTFLAPFWAIVFSRALSVLSYLGDPQIREAVFGYGPKVLAGLGWMKVNSSECLYCVVKNVLLETLQRIPGSFNGKDFAYILGKTLAAGRNSSSPVTLSKLTDLLTKPLSEAGRAMAITARKAVTLRGAIVSPNALADAARDLVNQLQQDGIQAGTDFSCIANCLEIIASTPDSEIELQNLAQSIDKFLPALTTLIDAGLRNGEIGH